jgi:prepilin signal peptidase PulO-like enzyme (type II secretory pathway)
MVVLISVSITLLGLITGLAINYLADVLPITRRFSQPACIDCQEPAAWQDYILFHRCRNCGKPAGLRKYFILIYCTAGTLILWLYPPAKIGFAVGWLLAAYLTLVAVIDLEHKLVLHPVSVAGAVICTGIGIWRHGILMTVLGGLAGFGFMLGLFYLGALFARWMAKAKGEETDEVALGFGDVILSGVLGLLLGWPGITGGLVLAILIGGLVSIGYLAVRMVTKSYQPFMAIPYAPFLVLGAAFLMFKG